MSFKTKKRVDHNKLLEELQAILGTDMTQWHIEGESVKEPDGSIVQKVRVVILNPSLKTTSVQKILDLHGSDPLEVIEAPVAAPSKKKVKRGV